MRLKFALGFQGIGKKKAGDNKTPVGLYGLAHPRKSNLYKVFYSHIVSNCKASSCGVYR